MGRGQPARSPLRIYVLAPATHEFTWPAAVGDVTLRRLRSRTAKLVYKRGGARRLRQRASPLPPPPRSGRRRRCRLRLTTQVSHASPAQSGKSPHASADAGSQISRNVSNHPRTPLASGNIAPGSPTAKASTASNFQPWTLKKCYGGRTFLASIPRANKSNKP